MHGRITILLITVAVLLIASRGGGHDISHGQADHRATEDGWKLVRVRVSNYWPPFGGPNCWEWDEKRGECVSRMASGVDWRLYADPGLPIGAAACPPEWPFGTRIRAFGKEWICLDRGGLIFVDEDGIPWIDLMSPAPPARYGQEVTVLVRFP